MMIMIIKVKLSYQILLLLFLVVEWAAWAWECPRTAAAASTLTCRTCQRSGHSASANLPPPYLLDSPSDDVPTFFNTTTNNNFINTKDLDLWAVEAAEEDG